MFFKNNDETVARNVLLISLAIIIGMIMIWAVPLYVGSCSVCGQMADQILLTTFFLFVFVAGFLPVDWRPRPAARIWSAFQLTAHVIFLFDLIMSLKFPWSEPSRCVSITSEFFYYLLYTPILYYVVTADTMHWRQHGKYGFVRKKRSTVVLLKN